MLTIAPDAVSSQPVLTAAHVHNGHLIVFTYVSTRLTVRIHPMFVRFTADIICMYYNPAMPCGVGLKKQNPSVPQVR